LADEAATLALGSRLARVLEPGMAIYLIGELGAGKTTLTRGLLGGLGHKGRVKSPTYTLVESYPLEQLTVHHFDLYRMADPEEWEDAGFRDYFSVATVCLIEWPDKAADLLPPADITIMLSVADEGREFSFHALTDKGHACLTRLTTPADAA
jgi:tRNA threonylcarbamoyladenosine biosynthesis protein TsaE